MVNGELGTVNVNGTGKNTVRYGTVTGENQKIYCTKVTNKIQNINLVLGIFKISY
jgi:hypothetical protein